MNSLNALHTKKAENLYITPEQVKEAFAKNLAQRKEDEQNKGEDGEASLIDTKQKPKGVFSGLGNFKQE